MTNVRTSLPIPTQPWEAAKAKFLENLSPEDTIRFKNATLENLFYDASVAQKKQAQSRSWLVQERLSSLVEAVDDYGKALDVFANTSSLVISPIWGSLRVILHIAGEAGKFQESLVDMLAQIGDVLPRFRIYQVLFKSHERLAVALSSVYLEILHFCVITKDFFVQARKSMIPLSIILKGAWKSHRCDFDLHMVRFRQHSKRVEREARVAHMIESARIREIQLANRALQIRNDKIRKRHRTLAALPAVDYANKHPSVSSLRHPGTNTWLQNTPEYASWAATQTSDCLCCYGIPGSGKSVLSASLIDDLQGALSSDETSLVCFHYCDYAESKSLSPLTVIGSITKQVLEHLPLDWYDEGFSCPFIEAKTSMTLPASLQYLQSLLQAFKITFLVIDGIDQLTAEGQSFVLDLLGDLLRNPSISVKIFVTSRSEEYLIKRTLKPHKSLQLSKKHVQNDVALFVEERVTLIAMTENPLLQNERLKREVVDALTSRANEMFLWVKFQLYDIAQALTEIAIRAAIQNLPKTLCETYTRIVAKIYHSSGGGDNFAMMQKVFMWVAGARRPLRIDELEEAVGLQTDDTYLHAERTAANAGQRLIACCGNLVVYNEDDSTVTFAHYTVQQYLRSSATANDIPFSKDQFSQASVDDHISGICLAYLSFSDFDTQLAKVPEVSSVEQKLAEKLVWSKVPLATPIKSMLAWSRTWRGASQPNLDHRVKFSVPVAARPSDILARKYAMLDYIVSFWAFHTADLTPQSSYWLTFKHVVIQRELSFNFRPWTEPEHRDRVEKLIRNRSEAREDHMCKTLLSDQSSNGLLLYSWAMRHGISSLLQLSDKERLVPYIELIAPVWDDEQLHRKRKGRPYHPHFLIETFIKSITARDVLRPSGYGFWSGSLFVQLILQDDQFGKRLGFALEFAKREYLRWADGGELFLDEMFCDASMLLLQSDDIPAFRTILNIHVCDLGQVAAILIAALRNGHARRDVIRSLLYHQVAAESRMGKHEWELIFALQQCYGMIEQILFDDYDGFSKLRPPIKNLVLALAVAIWKQPRIFSAFTRWTDMSGREDLESTGNLLFPEIDWTQTAFRTAEAYWSLQRLTDKDLVIAAKSISGLEFQFRALQKTGLLYDVGSRITISTSNDIVTQLSSHGEFFNAEAFEKDSIHCLLWAIEKGTPPLIASLVPHYKLFMCDPKNRRGILAILNAAKDRVPRVLIPMVPLLPDSVFRLIVKKMQTRSGLSASALIPFHTGQTERGWLTWIQNPDGTSKLEELAASAYDGKYGNVELEIILHFGFCRWIDMVYDWP